MLKQDYATAVLQILDAGNDIGVVLPKLKAQLERKGHKNLYPSILKEVIHGLERKNHARIPEVRVAREGDLKKHKAHIEALLKTITNETEYTTTIDETLIGGAVVEHNSKIIDASFKKKLMALYQALTT